MASHCCLGQVVKMESWRRRKQDRLYKQWVEHSELSPESIPPPETPAETKIGAAAEGRLYRFKVRIRDTVEKILGLK